MGAPSPPRGPPGWPALALPRCVAGGLQGPSRWPTPRLPWPRTSRRAAQPPRPSRPPQHAPAPASRTEAPPRAAAGGSAVATRLRHLRSPCRRASLPRAGTTRTASSATRGASWPPPPSRRPACWAGRSARPPSTAPCGSAAWLARPRPRRLGRPAMPGERRGGGRGAASPACVAPAGPAGGPACPPLQPATTSSGALRRLAAPQWAASSPARGGPCWLGRARTAARSSRGFRSPCTSSHPRPEWQRRGQPPRPPRPRRC
mmetsp:Transcript_3968/g.16562  ORF Transcript_3968/g.16562 Transcript_3968/m.16562 type:complete len:260 (+) Transcript_3968:324-1103(+)